MRSKPKSICPPNKRLAVEETSERREPGTTDAFKRTMPEPAPFKPPRRKISVLWWLGGAFLILLFLFFFQLFGPNAPIVVSRETTYITQPLKPSGLPDYEQHYLNLYRDGATSENNAGPLLLEALWPADLDPTHFAAVVAELEMPQVPSQDEALTPLYGSATRERVEKWLRELASRPRSDASPNDAFNDIDQLAYQEDAYLVIDQAVSRPWASEQIPPIARWATENKSQLDLIVEASRRPRYYVPSYSLIDNREGPLTGVLLPHVQAIRQTSRALPARAMWHLGEGRPMKAWQDLLAAHRLARLAGQGYTLVEKLVAMAMSNVACETTITLLHHGDLTNEQLAVVHRELNALKPVSNVAGALDQGERAMFLDTVVLLSSGSDHGGLSDLSFSGVSAMNYVSVNWNEVLRRGNTVFDRYVAAANLPDRAARVQAVATIEYDIALHSSQLQTPGTLVAAVLSPAARSDAIAAMMVGLMTPAVNAAMNAEDRSNTTLELVRLAAELAIYRAEHGEYPIKLQELVPAQLDELSVDLYNAQPFGYQREGDGYILYSLGENGVDDGGSNEQGEEIPELRSRIPTGADDISVRVPRPAFELPTSAPPADEP